jgi:hypothetical protein
VCKMKILIRTNQKERWERLNHTEYSGEAHLQDILYHDPDLIPIEDVPSQTDLSSIRLMLKEVGLPGSGNTDLIGVDKNGNIFIIETKLARNPEAKRQVIGQILEYAAFLHEKGIDWLDDVVRKQKEGVSIAEYFEELNEPNWDKEEFERNLRDSLNEGTFKLFIAVDEMNADLQRIINYMNNVLHVDIYALELRHFGDKTGMEILVPNVHGGKKPVISRPPPLWTEARFFEYTKSRVDDETEQTLRKLYDLSKRLGSVDFGSGKTIGTFGVSLQYKGELIRFFIVSPDRTWSWFSFNTMLQKGVDKSLILAYIRQLTPLGFQFEEAKIMKGGTYFDVTILNDEQKYLAFEKYSIELKETLQKQ